MTLRLIEAEPDLLDCDYDHELRAVLLGRGPDLRYIERLRQAGQEHDFLLQDFIKSLWAQASSPELVQRLASSQPDLLDARESAQLSLLQLHNQVQEELEQSFLKARASDQLAQAQFEKLQRSHRRMVRLHPDLLPTTPYSPSLAVQVLPEGPAEMPNSTLQTEALLSTYAVTLQRASALLERARRV